MIKGEVIGKNVNEIKGIKGEVIGKNVSEIMGD